MTDPREYQGHSPLSKFSHFSYSFQKEMEIMNPSQGFPDLVHMITTTETRYMGRTYAIFTN